MGARLSRAASRSRRVVEEVENLPLPSTEGVSRAEQSRAAQLEAQPGPESLDATQKVGSQAEALGKLIRQHTTSLSQEQTTDQVVRPRLGAAELEDLNRGRLTSRQLALLLTRCQDKGEAEVAAMASRLGVDPSLLQQVLRFHTLPLGLGSTTSGQLF